MFEGVVKNLERRPVDSDNTINIRQRCYAFASSEVDGAHSVVTGCLVDCVAVIMYSSEKGLGFMAHIDRWNFVTKAMDIGLKIDPQIMVLFGGSPLSPVSAETVACIEGFLIENEKAKRVHVAGRDLMRGPHARSHAIGFDAVKSEVFVPDIEPDWRGLTVPKFSLHYDGGHVAKENAFVELARSAGIRESQSR